MSRQRAQGLVLFGAALPVLLGCLGLALDGGYYLAAWQAAQFAADAAARAAAVDVERAQAGQALLYLSATADGQTTAQQNLDALPLRLSDVSIEIAYNTSILPDVLLGGIGWDLGLPTPLTASVRATVSATYTTMFLRIVGISSVDLRRAGEQPLAVTTIQHILPLAVCQTTANNALLLVWTLWENGTSLCGVAGWSGLINLDGSATNCDNYYSWIGPPASGPPPATGSAAHLETTRSCSQVAQRTGTNVLPPPSIVVVDTTSGKVLGCHRVTVASNPVDLPPLIRASVLGTPIGSLQPCDGILQIK